MLSRRIASPYRADRSPTEIRLAGVGSALLLFTFVAITVGYQCVAMVSILFQRTDSAGPIAFRIAVSACALLSLFLVVVNNANFKSQTPLFVFFFMFGARLIWDSQKISTLFPDLIKDSLLFLANTVFPCVMAMIWAKYWNEKRAAMLVLVTGGLFCVTSFLADRFGIGGIVSYNESTGRLRFDKINPLLIAHAALTTVIAGFVVWRGAKSLLWKGLVIVFTLFAIYCIIQANSRSPYVSAATCILVYLIARGRWAQLVGIITISIALLLTYNITEKLYGSRLVAIGDESSLIRLEIQRNCIEMFKQNPFFGGGYIDPITQMYPHNLFIDSASSMGVLGLGLFIYLAFRSCLLAYEIMKTENVLLPLIFCQMFIFANLSGSIAGTGIVFVPMIIMAELANTRRSQRDPWRLPYATQLRTLRRGGLRAIP